MYQIYMCMYIYINAYNNTTIIIDKETITLKESNEVSGERKGRDK